MGKKPGHIFPELYLLKGEKLYIKFHMFLQHFMGNVLKWYVLFGFPVLSEAPLYLLPDVISEGIYKTCGKSN
jgi:hypothetical protein